VSIYGQLVLSGSDIAARGDKPQPTKHRGRYGVTISPSPQYTKLQKKIKKIKIFGFKLRRK
jgi:hypothetical protein